MIFFIKNFVILLMVYWYCEKDIVIFGCLFCYFVFFGYVEKCLENLKLVLGIYEYF